MAKSDLAELSGKELIALVLELMEENERLRAENAELRKELDSLKRKKSRSATPFSKGQRKSNPRKPGRKAGQGRFERREAPEPNEGDDVRQFKAPVAEERKGKCPLCGLNLSVRTEFATTTDIPEIIIRRIDKWEVEVAECSCGYRERGAHPKLPHDQHGATAHRVGPRTRAFALALHYYHGVPMRKVPTIVKDITGIELTQSALTQEALRLGTEDGLISQQAERIKESIQSADYVNTDDTGWKTGGAPSYLMGFVSRQAKAVYYQIRPQHRAQEVAEVITASCRCVLGTDRFSSYDAKRFDDHEMQKCLSHILRNLSEVLELKKGRSRSFCQGLKDLLKECLALWHRFHNGELSQEAYEEAAMAKICELEEYLRDRQLKDPDNQRVLNELGWHFDRGNLTKFLEDPEVEPTNNIAERILRPAVIARKVSQCSKNERGANAYAAFKSVVQTLALRKVPSIWRSLADLMTPRNAKA